MELPGRLGPAVTSEALARRLWHLLPSRIRTSRIMRGLRRPLARLDRFGGATPNALSAAPHAVATPGPRVITDLGELDDMMERLDAAARISDDELRRLFPTFAFELELRLPDDPYAEAYRERVFELFELVRGERYDPSNERTPIDLDACAAAPFPYATQSPETVGDQLMAIGHLIKTMNLRPKSRVLELGSGWGNVALALAQMGHSVTTIDIDPGMAALVRERARQLGVVVEARTGDFMSATELGRRFESVLFVSSFHHAVRPSCTAGVDARTGDARRPGRVRRRADLRVVARTLVSAPRRGVPMADPASRLARARVP